MTREQGTNESLEKAKETLKELLTLQDAFKKKIADLRAKLADENTGAFARSKANLALKELEGPGNIMKDAKFNAKVITAGADIRKAQKAESTTCQGASWWTNRQLEEVKKYKP